MKQAERWYSIYYKYIRDMTVQVIYFEDLLVDVEKPMTTVVDYVGVEIDKFGEVKILFFNYGNNIMKINIGE